MKNHQINIWKNLFFLLLLTITYFIIIIGVSFIDYIPTTEEIEVNEPSEISNKEPVFSIKMTKGQVNDLISRHLVGDSNEKYRVKLGEKVRVESFVYIFNRQVPIELIFDPNVTEEGDLVLRQESFLVGFLQIPGDMGLQALKNDTQLPNWITISADQEMIHLKVSEVDVDEYMFLKLKSFNLEGNEIELDVYYQ